MTTVRRRASRRCIDWHRLMHRLIYDYTLVNGLVTRMVMNSSSKMTIGDITTEKQNLKNYSFVWEEVK